jgi:hypothetical protein
METELTPQQILKQKYNDKQYSNKKPIYKMQYIFKQYPHIQTEYKTQIADYLKLHGTEINDNFITFLRGFVPPKKRPRTYKDRPTKTLPKVIQQILDNTSI